MTTEPIPDRQAAQLAVLLDSLSGVPVSAEERATLIWLAGSGAEVVENIAAVIRRARVVRW